MSAADDVSDWLRLALVPGIGSAALRKLLGAFGLPKYVLAARPAQLAKAVGDAHAALIQAGPDAAALAQALHWLDEAGHHILTLADESYPKQLLEISDPPVILYVVGDPALLQQPMLAIVGSRNATPQGAANAKTFAHAFSNAGLTIVSGLALGIDAAAHQGALEGDGSTVAVLGNGVDIVYPRRNADLYASITERGALVSEFPLGAAAVAAHFPQRNRIISGLARGCLVVEAALSSGSLITARSALEQGREVFAIPGSIHSTLSKGCHALIKQGAKLVESAHDVLEELNIGPDARPAPQSVDADVEGKLFQYLGYDPIGVDSLCTLSRLTPDVVSTMLLELELAGKVASMPGGHYQRVR